MNTLAQASTMEEICEGMRRILTDEANRLARPTGLIIRKRKFSGALFAHLLVLGWLHDPHASLESLAQFGASLGLSISAQGLDERFTVPAATFLRALLACASGQVIRADPVNIPLLARFSAVILEDSSTIPLPDELAGVFEGGGGSEQEGMQAALKMQVRWDLLSGQLAGPGLQDGRASDHASPLQEQPLPHGALHIRDRGYFDVQALQQEVARGVYSLTYLKGGVLLFDEQDQPLDWLLVLATSGACLERQVPVGSQRAPMPLLAVRAPIAVAAERRKRLRKEAHAHGRVYQHEQDLRAGWTLVVTNVPVCLLSLQEARVLLRSRWQIELLWKLWKQYGAVDDWRSQQPWRILCEVFAKLLGLLIQHWVLLLSCWQQPHRSLVKAAKAVRSHAILLAYALAGTLALDLVLRQIQQAAQVGARLNTRKTYPNTSQVLLAGLDCSLT